MFAFLKLGNAAPNASPPPAPSTPRSENAPPFCSGCKNSPPSSPNLEPNLEPNLLRPRNNAAAVGILFATPLPPRFISSAPFFRVSFKNGKTLPIPNLLSDNPETIGVTDLANIAPLPRVPNIPASGNGIYFCSLFSFSFSKKSINICTYKSLSNGIKFSISLIEYL